MKRAKSPLNRKLVSAVLSISAVASLAVSFAQIYFAWSSRLSEISSEVEARVNASMPSLRRGIWYLDEKYVKASLDVIAASPHISRIEVTVSGRPGIFALAGDPTKKFDYDQTWVITGLADKMDSEIAKIRVFESFVATNSALLKEAKFIVGTNMLKGLALSLVLLAIFDRLVTAHIRELMRHLYRFNVNELVPISRRSVRVRDEVDYLIDAINDMQESVRKSRDEETAAKIASEEAHNKTADLAMKVGAAEVTTSVLHDVSNILGSLTVIAMRGERDLKTKDPRDVAANLIEGVTKISKTITGIIHSQQKIAKGTADQWDSLHVRDIIGDAISIEGYQLEKYQVKLNYSGDLDQVIVTRRHVMVSVFVNLIKNARESIQAANPESREILVSAEVRQNKNLILTVRDTGVGATAATLARVLERGFTTKETGHGFGLVGCKFNLEKLGGDIALTSPGLGLGATVTITHPLDASEVVLKAADDKALGPESSNDKIVEIKHNLRKG